MDKIIYISFTTASHYGVRKKNEAQVSSWKLSGCSVRVVYDLESKYLLKKILWRYFILISYFIFGRDSEANLYLRQTPCLPGMGFITRFRDFCYEVNADISKESLNYSGVAKAIHYFLLRDKFLGRAYKIFYVSSELKERLSRSALGSGYVFPNSIPITFQPKKHLPRCNNIVFVGNPDLPWQGVDHLFRLIDSLPDYNFHLVGSGFETIFNNKANVEIHGLLTGNDYESLMKKMDFAIGTLAFYRSGLSEGSPLKVRDYIAFDLPVIVGYFDSDFYDESFVHFSDFSKNDSDISDIKAFFEQWRHNSVAEHLKSEWFFHEREKMRSKAICS